MTPSPTVSVLIPTYNYANYLDEAIQSVLNQTFKDFELIIVDDRSKDNTAQVVQKYLADSRVSFFINDSNIGLVRNFNKCLEYAKGKYIKFLMADDLFYPTLLEKYVAVMEKYPTVSLVTAYRKFVGKDAELKQEFAPFTQLQEGKKIIYETLKTHNWIGEPTTVMFRKSNLSLGLFDTNYNWIPDWEMWLRQLTVGDCFIIPEVLSCFRQHEKQATVALTKSCRRFFEEYFFFKKIQNDNTYKLDLTKIPIANIVKKKARICSRSAIKLLPKAINKRNRELVLEGFRVTYQERLFLSLF